MSETSSTRRATNGSFGGGHICIFACCIFWGWLSPGLSSGPFLNSCVALPSSTNRISTTVKMDLLFTFQLYGTERIMGKKHQTSNTFFISSCVHECRDRIMCRNLARFNFSHLQSVLQDGQVAAGPTAAVANYDIFHSTTTNIKHLFGSKSLLCLTT